MKHEDNTIGDYERGIETMRRLWGEDMAEKMRAIWKNANSDVERYITAFALGEVWSRPVLDLKTRSLLCLAASVALERDDQVRLHTRGALRSGATPDEVAEAIVQLMVYASFPAAWRAMVVASEVMAEHKTDSSKPSF